MTLADYLERYVESLHLKKTQTQISYTNNIKRVRRYPIGSIKLKDLTKTICREYISNLINDYADSTVKGQHNFIKQAIRHGIDEEYLETNPFDFPIKKMLSGKVIRPAIALTDKEFDSLINEMQSSSVYRFYIPHLVLLRETGLRISEFCALTDDDVDFENRMLRINKQIGESLDHKQDFIDTPKTESSNSYVPLTSVAIDAIRSIMSYTTIRQSLLNQDQTELTEGMFVLSKRHKSMNRNSWDHIFKNITKFYNKKHSESELVVRPHTLRHTTATRLLEKGLSVPSTQKMLRHSSPQTTLSLYTHFTANTLQAELDKLSMD